MRELVSRIVAVVNGENIVYKEISGDSTDTKPTTGICDGSIFVESNTGKTYFFNEKTGGWVEQFTFKAE